MRVNIRIEIVFMHREKDFSQDSEHVFIVNIMSERVLFKIYLFVFSLMQKQ